MFKSVELFIGLRYTRAKRRNHFISFISASSMLGIMLGVMALITVLSVMNGFHKEVRDRILGMASHATIEGIDGQLTQIQRAIDLSKDHPNVVGYAPYIEMKSMLTRRQRVNGALVRGIDPALESHVSEVGEKMTMGQLSDPQEGKYNIILGAELAAIMHVTVGSKITVLTPKLNMTPTGNLPRLKTFTVSGLFEVGMGEYDRGVAIVHIKDAAKLLRLGDSVTGIRLKLDDMYLAREVTHELANDMKGIFRVSNWTYQHSNFFSALETEKLMMGLILSLIVAVAAFNIVSTLVMVVTDKQSDIAILRTLGASPLTIMKIFIIQGTMLGFIGTILGVVMGVLLAVNLEYLIDQIEVLFNVQFIDPDIYYISKLPSDLHWDDVGYIASGAFLISILATLYPAWTASKVEPAEALRYE